MHLARPPPFQARPNPHPELQPPPSPDIQTEFSPKIFFFFFWSLKSCTYLSTHHIGILSQRISGIFLHITLVVSSLTDNLFLHKLWVQSFTSLKADLIYYVKRSNGDINAVFAFSKCLKMEYYFKGSTLVSKKIWEFVIKAVNDWALLYASISVKSIFTRIKETIYIYISIKTLV